MSASLAKSSSLISQFGSIPKKLVRLPKFIGSVVQQENKLQQHEYRLRVLHIGIFGGYHKLMEVQAGFW